MIRELHQCQCAVEIVGIGDAERSIDERSGRLDCLSGAGDRSLDNRHDREVRRPEGPDVVEQLVLDLLSHDENDTVETGRESVASREVHERLASRPNWSKLFQASEPTAVTGCKQDELHG